MQTPLAEIRRARAADAVELARLSDELGYAVSPSEMETRLGILLADERHCIVVAANGDRLLAWAHIEHRFWLGSEDRAELMGLVVDSTARRRGLGRELVDAAETWTRERGLSTLIVRSNVLRDGSHEFYASLGFSRTKTQHVYRRPVSGERLRRDAKAGTLRQRRR